MDDLLPHVLPAHGVLDRWSQVTGLTAQMFPRRPCWVAVGRPSVWSGQTVTPTHTASTDVTTYPIDHPRLPFLDNVISDLIFGPVCEDYTSAACTGRIRSQLSGSSESAC